MVGYLQEYPDGNGARLNNGFRFHVLPPTPTAQDPRSILIPRESPFRYQSTRVPRKVSVLIKDQKNSMSIVQCRSMPYKVSHKCLDTGISEAASDLEARARRTQSILVLYKARHSAFKGDAQLLILIHLGVRVDSHSGERVKHIKFS